MGKKCKKVWRAALLCLFWTMWRERNRAAFDNEVFSAYRLKSYFIRNFWPGPTCIVGTKVFAGFFCLDGV